MASKGRESWDKRQRERTKKDRQAAKRAERAERRSSENEIDDEGPSEAELYERFAQLSASHANGEIDDETFEIKKEEIFELLGVQLHS
ncbi:MAG: hypothetical protein VX763_03560 [Actinomycetota bacterium]|nr:hypothetical protein [Actinomycetota bacterium]MEC8985675.1 hypothetical protein [Actinomycetota bacterium]